MILHFHPSPSFSTKPQHHRLSAQESPMPGIMSASIERSSENGDQTQMTTTPSSFLDLPTEIRYAIYDALICLPHSLVITLREYKLGTMDPLSLTCSQLYNELSKWTNALVQRPSSAHLIVDPTFGLLNAKTTSVVWCSDSFHVFLERKGNGGSRHTDFVLCGW